MPLEILRGHLTGKCGWKVTGQDSGKVAAWPEASKHELELSRWTNWVRLV